MNSLNLRGKFLITLSLGAVAVLVVFLFALQAVSNIDGTFAGIRQIDLPGKVAAIDIAKDVNYLSRLTRNIMLGGDFDKDMRQFQDTSAGIEKKFAELATFDFTQDEKALIRVAHAAATDFARNGNELMSPLKKMAPEQRYTAYKDYEKLATPSAMAFREAFGKFEKAMNARFDRAITGMQEDIALKKKVMWGVLFLAVAGMYVMGFLITHRDLSVMNSCVEFAGQLGGGEIDRRLDTRGCASLRQLAEALNTTADSLSVFRADVAAATGEATRERDEAKQALAGARAAREEADRARADGMLHAARRLDEAVTIVSSASQDLSTQIERSGQGSLEQARRVDETSTAIGQMNDTVLDVARNASQAADTADKARQKALDGSSIVSRVIGSIGEVQAQALGLRNDMSVLGGQAEGIGRVMGVIADIADQTNLLALNAAIEAARAGDAGRGFAVVADEVRKLAEKTMTATKEVGEAIQGIQQGTRKNIENVERTVRIIDEATGQATTSGQALQDIVSLVDRTTDQVRSIASASEEQSAASEQITSSIAEVSQISASTAESMRQSAQAVELLADQARVLKDMIESMKADGRGRDTRRSLS